MDGLVLGDGVIKLLAVHGLWHTTNPTLMCSGLIFLTGSYFHLYWYLCKQRATITFIDISDDITLILSFNMVTFLYLYFFKQRRNIEALLCAMADFRLYRKPARIERISALFSHIAKAIVIWMYVSLVVSVVLMLFEDCTNYDHVVNDCGLLYIAYNPFFDIYTTSHRKFYGVLQIVIGFPYATGASLIILLVVLPIEVFVDYLNELEAMLRVRRCKIKTCVLYHYRIITLVDRYNNLIRPIFTLYLFFGSLILGIIIYTLLIRFRYRVFIHLMCYFTTIATSCFFGERLRQQSERIAAVIYEATLRWDDGNMDVRMQKDWLLMMQRAQQPLTVDNGLSPMGYEYFVKMMQGTYSLLTLLLSIQEN